MDHIKIIFFDIDGTLIDLEKKYMTDRMLQTLQRLKQRGILLYAATGRSPMILPKFESFSFDGYITFNGSYCYNDSGVIYSNPIPAEDIQILLRNAKALGRPVSVATNSRVAANGKDQDLIDYYGFANLPVIVNDDFDIVAAGQVFQMMLGCTEREYPALMQDVKRAKIAAWWDRAVDVIPSDSGKNIGIHKILEYHHLQKEDALAFGDGNNDIDMLLAVGTGVAMGNASAKLKEVADDVCGHVAEDGIYHYCLSHELL